MNKEEEKPTTWDWIKATIWLVLAAVIGLLVFPYWVFRKLQSLCGSWSEPCAHNETIQWLTTTAIGGAILAALVVLAFWVYYPLIRAYARMIIQQTSTPPAIVRAGAVLFVGLWLGLLSALILPDHQGADSKSPRGLQEITQRYQQFSDAFDLLATELENDGDITDIYCDENMVYVSTPDETFYDGEDDYYTTKYIPICRFDRKVAAYRSERGIRFPHDFFEVGPLAVSSFLERRRDQTDIYDECGANLFRSERNGCEFIINEHWSATYVWEPFCRDYMKGEAGC